MDLNEDPRDAAFRAEVRAFIEANLPEEVAARIRASHHPSVPDRAFWTRKLYDKGWSAPHWPVEQGGPGWTAMQRHIFEEEMILHDAPPRCFQNFNLIGPLIYTFGSDAQKAEYLPKILKGETFFAQGFSEPGSGSDLASLKTRAERDVDDYVINGQKIWTSDAHQYDMLFLLARTQFDGKPQAGISMFLFPTNTPGVDVRKIVTLDGRHATNEVFLDNVRIPATARLGEENKGWTYAKALLNNERTFSAEVPSSKRDLAMLKRNAAKAKRYGRPLIEDPEFAARLARVEIDLMALEYAVLRVVQETSGTNANAVASVLKVRGSEIRQRVADLLVEALQELGLVYFQDQEHPQEPFDPGMPPDVGPAPGITATALFRRVTTIYGGSNEIQRNLIAKNILELG